MESLVITKEMEEEEKLCATENDIETNKFIEEMKQKAKEEKEEAEKR